MKCHHTVDYLFLSLGSVCMGEVMIRTLCIYVNHVTSLKEHFTTQGEYLDTSKLLGRCLEILGRPLPTSRLDMTCSLVWHIFRQIVHRLFVTRWLTAKAAKWCSFRRVDEKDIKYRQESAKQAALVYHQLHQLYLKGILCFCMSVKVGDWLLGTRHY